MLPYSLASHPALPVSPYISAQVALNNRHAKFSQAVVLRPIRLLQEQRASTCVWWAVAEPVLAVEIMAVQVELEARVHSALSPRMAAAVAELVVVALVVRPAVEI
jgi:hypothetical protein